MTKTHPPPAQKPDLTPAAAGIGTIRKPGDQPAEQGGDASRARASGALQRTVGNARTGRMLGQAKIQRQPPPQPPQPPNPQQIYAQALTRLAAIDPTIHGYISQAPLGGSATTIRTTTGTTPDVPPVTVQSVFSLQVQLGSLTSADAKFGHAGLNMTPAGTTRTITAPMQITVRSGIADANSLAATLYHEGIHMMLYMDQLVPTGQVSPHTAALGTYTAIARAHPSFLRLLAELEVYIELDLQIRSTRTTPGVPALPPPAAGYSRRVSREITDNLIEEKYAFDREKAAFQTQSPNQAIALSYIVSLLTDEGVRATSTNADVIRMAGLATQVYNAIDNRPAPAAPSGPAPGVPSSTPKASPSSPAPSPGR